ncbi:PLP-dependent transferase [Calocera viscosa TUFC12733]|uniref:PLP-dependent transferase n=1 Tax=Calocera viscosa (strain TUFC12733) TaxID=1330018 RepID=A0A167RN25_CALVF|nr:PLP-dependent transferase [Calocera viscosa TUFC12733]
MTTAPLPAVNGTLESGKAGFRLSKDVQGAAIPAIPVARRWIERYLASPLAAQQQLIDVSQGVPGTPPPPSLLSALALASSSPDSAKYGAIAGEAALRSLLASEMRRLYGEEADLKAGDVAISAGANLAFVSVIMCVCDPGDEVIIAVPWYFNQEQVLAMRGVTPVPLRTRAEDAFVPRVEEAEALITPRTKAITLVSPNNPTGAIYPPSLLAQFALLAKRKSIALILDETYRDFLGSAPHTLFSPSLASSSSEQGDELAEAGENWEWRKHLISLYSFSKSYAVPGHRLGAVVCGEEVMDQVEKVLDCLQICPPRAIQLALVDQIPAMRTFVSSQAQTLATRHAALKSVLPARWKLAAQGGFFAYVHHPFPGKSSYEVCERLALELGVAGLPGTFFQPPEGRSFWGGVEKAREEDRWLRIGVANVGVETIRMLGGRLREAEERWGWEMDE